MMIMVKATTQYFTRNQELKATKTQSCILYIFLQGDLNLSPYQPPKYTEIPFLTDFKVFATPFHQRPNMLFLHSTTILSAKLNKNTEQTEPHQKEFLSTLPNKRKIKFNHVNQKGSIQTFQVSDRVQACNGPSSS